MKCCKECCLVYWSLLIVEVVLEVEDDVDLLVQVSHLVDWISLGELPVECEPFGGRLPDDFCPRKLMILSPLSL